jgi:hypothetical protein
MRAYPVQFLVIGRANGRKVQPAMTARSQSMDIAYVFRHEKKVAQACRRRQVRVYGGVTEKLE